MFSKVKICFLMITILALLLAPACGGGDDEDNTSTPTATAAPTATATATATPTVTATQTATPTVSKEPVKIGVFSVWSGAAALAGVAYTDPVIKVVEKQVEDRGGILGGRPLKITKYDTQGTVAGAQAAATKAMVSDNLSVVSGGGVASPETISIAEVACKENAFYTAFTPLFDTPERECMVESTISSQMVIAAIVHVITEQVKPTPKTVGILVREGAGIQDYIDGWKKGYESAGIKTVYETIVSPDTVDFSPYLTQIKYRDPDVLITLLNTAHYMAMAKQMSGLGGWGNIQVVGDPTAVTAATTKGAGGWITVTPWYPGMDNPESRKFVQDFQTVTGKVPAISHIYMYFAYWTAIHAIELAGTAEDGKAIAKAARSGKLGFDTPMGPVHFNADGRPEITLTSIQIEEGGKVVLFE